ncbi:MAG: cytochrome c biogenesis protein ResB [Deltaproteobacteria bacterium]|nr:cytochrome c biogenesis protein ResB [Deltaproteobacteria bacterium]
MFLKNPSFDETRGGEFIYRLADIRTGEYYTGLMVTRNPGVNIVWLGSALGGVGLFLAFFLPHRRTIVRLADGKITLGYTDSRARDVSEEKFAELVERFGGRTKSSENKKA